MICKTHPIEKEGTTCPFCGKRFRVNYDCEILGDRWTASYVDEWRTFGECEHFEHIEASVDDYIRTGETVFYAEFSR